MSIQLEAHFENGELAGNAVDKLRQSGIIFDILDLKPAAARWKSDDDLGNAAINSAFSKIPDGFVAQYPANLPFHHICARAYMAAGEKGTMGSVVPASKDDMLLRIMVTKKSLGKAEKIIRSSKGYGLKVRH